MKSSRYSNDGGAIDSSGSLSLERCSLSSNVTTGMGGGISSTGNLTASGSTLIGNTGGGIDSFATTTISGSTITQNTGGSGGGIYNHSNGTLTVTNSTLSHNTATLAAGYGGGIVNNGMLSVSRTDTLVHRQEPLFPGQPGPGAAFQDRVLA